MWQKILAKLMRVFFRLLYHQFTWSYDTVAAVVSLGQWKEWVWTTLPYLDGPRVLELGFGPGHLQSALSSRGVSAFGADASPQMARLTKYRLLNKGQSYQLTNSYAQKLPYPNALFDQVVTTFPTNYIFEENSLSEIRRVLVPGGQLVILPNAWITGKKFWEKTAAGIFEITGQAPPWNNSILEYFSNAGFTPRIERLTTTSWSLVIILAENT